MVWLLLLPVLLYFLSIRQIHGYIRLTKSFKSEGDPITKVSIIVPCRNEEKNLPYLLSDLLSQDYNAELFEVIIIDDNSTDNTFHTATIQKGIKNYKVLHSPYAGKKSAIRFGVDNASGELIITTDADCRLGRKWITSHAIFYTSARTDMIIGPVKLEAGKGFFGGFQELEFLSLQGVTAGTALANDPVMCNGANLSFTKAAYLKHSGNLHPEILSGDDIFLLHSLKKDRDSVILWLNSPDGIVTTSQSGSLCSFIRQRARWVSKAGSYRDLSTIRLAIVTFVTIFLTAFFIIAGLFDNQFWLLWITTFIIKSVPDFLLLREITGLYMKKGLLKWFIPSQVVYPFYVLIVVGYSLAAGRRWK